MKPEYEAFLDELCEKKRQHYHVSCRADLTRADLVRASCNQFTLDFVRKFPHLKRQPGFYGSPVPEENYYGIEHWWCVDVDGTIVDPTAEQFRPGGTYTPLDPDKHLVQIGRCIECGDYIYGRMKDGPKCICGPECQASAEAYYNSI